VKHALLLLSLAGIALASGTQAWEVASRLDLAKGEFQQTCLTSDGEVVLGRATREVKSPGASLWSSAVAPDGTIWFGTGAGNVCRLADDKLEVVFETKEMLVTALVADASGGIYAATLPNGKVFKVDAKGVGSLLCTLPAGQVFALSPDGKGGLFAGTGPGGKIFSIDADGKSKEFYDTKRENVLCLSACGNGDLLAGTSLSGTVFRISPEGRGWVVADFGETEVVSVAQTDVGTYVAVNSGNKTNPADFLKAVGEAAAKEPADPSKGPQPKPEKGKTPQVASALVLVTPTGDVIDILGYADTYITCLAPWEGGEVLLGTNNSGKVWRVGRDMNYSVLLDLKENQVLTFAQDASGVRAVGTGMPGAAHMMEKDPPKAGSYMSEVLDGQFVSRWGRLDWRGSGKLVFRTRTGNSGTADDGTWSDWSAPIAQFPSKVASPAARYLQFRAEWTDDAAAVLDGATVMYTAQNQRPRIQEFTMEDVPPGADGKKSGQKKLKWKVVDPDSDAAAVNVYYRAVGAQAWVPVNREAPLTGAEYAWAIDGLADGKYQVKLEATDEGANPKETALKSERITRPFTIDNTKPVVAVAIAAAGTATGTAQDAGSWIGKVEYRVDGGPWRPVGAKDGMLDDPREEFTFALGELPAGTHIVTVRATDGDQNTAVAEMEYRK